MIRQNLFLKLLALVALAIASTTSVQAQDKPQTLGVGVFTFSSGPAAAYGLPGRRGAELMIERINQKGGIHGVPISATFVDEAQGADGVIAEYRRLGEDDNNQVMIAALSSGNCLALAPLADQYEMPTINWNCDTHQLFLKQQPDYMFRPASRSSTASTAAGSNRGTTTCRPPTAVTAKVAQASAR